MNSYHAFATTRSRKAGVWISIGRMFCVPGERFFNVYPPNILKTCNYRAALGMRKIYQNIHESGLNKTILDVGNKVIGDFPEQRKTHRKAIDNRVNRETMAGKKRRSPPISQR